jgi:hypothetical protein
MTVPWLIGGVLLLEVSDIDERPLYVVTARKSGVKARVVDLVTFRNV